MKKSLTDFSQLVKLLDWIGSCIGIAVFVDKKLNLKMLFYRLIWITNFVLFDYGLWYSVFAGKDIMLSILAGTIGFATTMIIKFYYDLVVRRSTVMTFLNWCKKRHDPNEKDNKLVATIKRKRFDQAFKISMKIVRVTLKSMYVNETVTTFMPTIFYYLMGHGWVLPFPAALPGFRNDDWISFCLNFVYQAMGIMTGNFLCCMYFSVLTIIVIYLIAQLDVVIDIIKRLQVISENQEIQKIDLKEFSELIAVIIDLQNDVVKLFNKLIDFTSKIFLWIEFDCIGGILLIWFIFFVEKSHQGIAIGANILIIFSFGACFLNERIQDKFEDITMETYSIHWYNLGADERRILALMILHAQNPPSFNAGGFNDETNKRFWTLMSDGYEMCCIMQKIIILKSA